MEKRYYWLKFQSDFFESKRIKKLSALGKVCIVIYLKMQLKSLPDGGYLYFTGVEDDFASELALDIDEKPAYVRKTVDFLLAHELLIKEDEHTFFMPWVAANTGSETASTMRWRDWKKRKMLESNKEPTENQRNANVEKEIEKEIDIKEKYKRKGRKYNAALDYKQTPINESDFNKLVVDLGGEKQ
jgi:predicted phage replisome organizer